MRFLIFLNLTCHPRYKDSYHAIWTISQALPIPIFWCCSVTQSCLTLCDCMYSRNPRLPCPSNCPQFSQTRDLWVSDALQPSPPALNLSQHQFLSSDFALGLRWPIYWLFMFSISPSINSQSWLPSCFTSLNSMLTTELLNIFSIPAFAKHRYFGTQFLWSCSLLHTLHLKINFDCSDLFSVISPPFNMVSSLVIAFRPRSKWLLVSWLQSLPAVTLEVKKVKPVTYSIVSHRYISKWWTKFHDLIFLFVCLLLLSFNPAFPLSPFTFIRRLFSS